jgi:hypothetical protein
MNRYWRDPETTTDVNTLDLLVFLLLLTIVGVGLLVWMWAA